MRDWKKAGQGKIQEVASSVEPKRIFGFDREFKDIPIDDIAPDPDQPRKIFRQEDIDGLAASMADGVGVIQPISVRRVADTKPRYAIIVGERRWRAATAAGLKAIPAIVHPKDVDIALLALLENLQRVDLSPLEEALQIRKLIGSHAWSQEDACRALGKTTTYVSRSLSLLGLPDQVQEELLSGDYDVNRSILVEIAQLEGEDRQLVAWEKAKQGKLSVREAREGRAGAAKSMTTRRFGFAVRSFGKTLSSFLDIGEAPTTKQKAELRAVRDRLNQLIGE